MSSGVPTRFASSCVEPFPKPGYLRAKTPLHTPTQWRTSNSSSGRILKFAAEKPCLQNSIPFSNSEASIWRLFAWKKRLVSTAKMPWPRHTKSNFLGTNKGQEALRRHQHPTTIKGAKIPANMPQEGPQHGPNNPRTLQTSKVSCVTFVLVICELCSKLCYFLCYFCARDL